MAKLTKGQRNELKRQVMKARREAVEKLGYKIYRSLRAGANSTWSFDDPQGQKSVFGFDSPEEVVRHIEDSLKYGTSGPHNTTLSGTNGKLDSGCSHSSPVNR